MNGYYIKEGRYICESIKAQEPFGEEYPESIRYSSLYPFLFIYTHTSSALLTISFCQLISSHQLYRLEWNYG